MKCSKCRFQEKVPLWVLEELHNKIIDTNYLTKKIWVNCPSCDAHIYPVDILPEPIDV